MPNPLILYSTNSSLAYNVARHYYGDKHYVWCTPFFGLTPLPGGGYNMPASSSPAEIYNAYRRDIASGDMHSAKIQSNRAGILRGSTLMRRAKIIDKTQAQEISQICRDAQLADFKPLIYVIPFDLVSTKLKPVPINKRASPFSAEYILESLPADHFDIICP